MIERIEITLPISEEQCAGVDFLSGVCVGCGITFTPHRIDQVTCGKDACRKGRFKVAIRKQEHQDFVTRQMARRRAKSMPEQVCDTRGPKMRDGFKEQEKVVKDKAQQFSRCTHCGIEFVDDNGKPRTSSFMFCGESLLVAGDCKRAWLTARPTIEEKKPKFNNVTPDDVDWATRQKSVRAPLPYKAKTNYCPQCKEYVRQNHEHK